MLRNVSHNSLRLPVAGLFFLSTALLVGYSSAALAASYYVSPTGNDANPGTSTTTPWQTINKVNGKTFVAGDRIFFQGGQSFSGNLKFSNENGTTSSPIVVSSYGSGRATLNAGNGTGISVYNVGGFTISNLIVKGSGSSTNTANGIDFYNDRIGAIKLNAIKVDNVDVSRFGKVGIKLGAWPSDGSKSGYRDVRVTRSNAHDNLSAGIFLYGYQQNYSGGTVSYAHENVYVGNCKAYNNLGIANAGNNSGSGIILSDVNGGMVERCVAYNNGQNNNYAGGGPVGIWTYNSNQVTIQFNESYRNRTQTIDGGGFDLDGGVTNSILQYNYSHDNDGPGYLLWQFSGANPFGNNLVRYNISQNDGRKNSYSGLLCGGGVKNCHIYNNVIFTSPSAAGGTGTPGAVGITSGTSNFSFTNNIFMTTGGVRLLENSSTSGIIFQGNNYWSSGGLWSVKWLSNSYGSLDSWRRATGQEKSGGVAVGLSVDPQLRNPGGAGTVGNAALLETLGAYKLQANSPMIDAARGAPILSNLSPAKVDFYKNPLPLGPALDIGIHEMPLNLLMNPDFENEQYQTQQPSGWLTWGGTSRIDADADYTEAYGSEISGSFHMTHYKRAAYEVYTYQTLSGLSNGPYTLRAWAKSSGGQPIARMEAKGFDDNSTLRVCSIPISTTWQQITISGINVTNGKCTIGFYSLANAYQSIRFDEVEFFKG